MWFFFALIFAFTSSISSFLIAKRVMKEMDEYLYLALSGIFTVPFLFLIVVYFYQIPQIDITFILAILASVTIGIFAAIFAYRAIRISEISLVSPISAFNPVFTALIAFIILREAITLEGSFGILLICAGAYLLELSKANGDFFKPIKSLLTNKGVQLSFVAYFIWAVTPIFEKTAIFHTTPQVPPFVSLVGLSFSTLIFMIINVYRSRKSLSKNNINKVKKFIPIFIAVGILGALGHASAMVAFSLGNLGLVTSMFKLSMIFAVVWGWLFFKEQNIKNRIVGSLVMLVGVILLAT